MAEPTRAGSSTVPIVAIIAIFALVLLAAWYYIVRDTNTTDATETAVPQQAPPAPQSDPEKVEINVDLPDSVVIKP
jgi:hypothetical protein